jgi:integrase
VRGSSWRRRASTRRARRKLPRSNGETPATLAAYHRSPGRPTLPVARDEARIRARRGEYVNRSVSTVADYLAEWVETHASTVKPKTLAGYRHDIDHYIVPRIGRMRLQALRPAVLSKLYRDLAERGGRDGGPLSAWTVSHIHRTLRKALADAVHVEQLLAVNPAERSKRPRDRDTEPGRVWTTEQLDLFLTTARSHRLYAFYRLAAYTGARRGELLYLRWQAVDLNAAEVTFGGSTAVVRGQRVEGTTKGGRSRVVSIDRETVTILREHRCRQAAERQAAGPARTDVGGLVFVTKWGEPLYPDTVTALMNKLITAYNKPVTTPERALPHARLHDLRHLHATTFPGRSSGARRRRPAWPCRPGRDTAGLLTRPAGARPWHRGYLRSSGRGVS